MRLKLAFQSDFTHAESAQPNFESEIYGVSYNGNQPLSMIEAGEVYGR